MKCLFEFTGRIEGDRFIHRCVICGRELRDRKNVTAIKAVCRASPPADRPPPDYGPGTEFMRLTNELGLRAKGGCGCNSLKDQMNRLGVEGCRREKGRLLAALGANAEKFSWLDKLRAGAAAIAGGLPLTLEGLLDEAIRRADLTVPTP